MVADFEDYGELHGGVTAASIRGAADDPNAHTATVQALISDLADDDAAISSNVEGDIDDATRMNLNPADGAARRLAQNGMYAIGLLNSFADTVQTFDDKVDEINGDLHTQTSQRWSAQVHSGDDTGDGDRLTYDEIKAQVKAELKPRYDAAVNTLEDEADAVAGKFESGPTLADVKALVLAGYIALEHAGLWPNLQLTDDERKTAQVNTVKNMTTSEQVDYVRNTKDIDPAIASVISPEAQQVLADDVADDIKGKNVDEDTVRVLAFLKDQQPFAHRVFTTVTPDQITDVIQKFSNETYPNSSYQPYDQVERAKLYQDFLNATGHTFATFTKGEGAYSPPSDLADTWFHAITDETHPANATALTMLIKHGGHETDFQPDFLGDLTNKVYDWERGHDGSPVWGPLNDSLGEGYGIKDPSITYGDDDGQSYDDHAGYSTPFDGLANLLSGMEKTPEAAEKFFTYDDDGSYTDQVDYHDQQVNEKMKYFLTERRWPTDDGDGFGIALEQATTHDRGPGDGDPNHLNGAERAARLASQTLYVIANESGRSNGIAFANDWHLQEGARDNIGRMLASYAPDIQRIANGDGDSIKDGNWIWGDDSSEDAYHDVLGLRGSNSDLAKVLAEVGRGDNKDGITAVLTSQVVHNQNLMQDALDAYNQRHPDAPKTMDELKSDPDFVSQITRNGESNGTAISMVLSKGVEGGTDDEDARAARRELMSKAFSLGTEFIPTPQGKIASVLTSTALSEIGDAIGEAPDGKTKDWGTGSERVIQDGLSYGTYNVLLNNGYLSSSADPKYGIPHDAVETVRTTEDDGTVTTRTQIRPELYNGNAGDLPAGTEDLFNTWNASNGASGNAPRDIIAPLLNGYSNKTSAWLGSN